MRYSVIAVHNPLLVYQRRSDIWRLLCGRRRLRQTSHRGEQTRGGRLVMTSEFIECVNPAANTVLPFLSLRTASSGIPLERFSLRDPTALWYS